jgi:hypothetical protein
MGLNEAFPDESRPRKARADEFVDPPGGGSLVRPGKVRVEFDYYPDDPDPGDETGMSEDEFIDLTDRISQLGGDNLSAKRVGS